VTGMLGPLFQVLAGDGMRRVVGRAAAVAVLGLLLWCLHVLQRYLDLKEIWTNWAWMFNGTDSFVPKNV